MCVQLMGMPSGLLRWKTNLKTMIVVISIMSVSYVNVFVWYASYIARVCVVYCVIGHISECCNDL
jgi:hypothetical protein